MSFRAQNEYEKQFTEIVRSMTGSYQTWQVWADLITVIACTLSNVADRRPDHYEPREKEYLETIKRLNPEKAAEAFSIIVRALDDEPDQDFLGSMYMRLDLGNHWKGQFFTPYNVCRMMAEMQFAGAKEIVSEKGWISVCDPAVGGGAMLIAAANTMQRMRVNYQSSCLFAGQDIDRLTGMMAFIQLSLLGCPGYIVIADTLTNPMVGDPLMPTEMKGQEFWYTPFYHSDIWTMRRKLKMVDRLLRSIPEPIKRGKDRYTFYFNFEEDRNVRTE